MHNDFAGNDSDDEVKESRKRSVRFMDDNDNEADQKDDSDNLPSHVTPLQAMMLKMAGQTVPSSREPSNRTNQDEDFGNDEDDLMDDDGPQESSRPKPPGPPPGLPPGPPPGMPPAMMGRPGMLPPGPPPGRPPTMPMNMGHRMMSHPESDGRLPDHGMRMNPNILSAPPSLIHRPDKDMDDTQAATITAKPMLTTNPKVDSTRFMPTSLRIRREVKSRSGAAASTSSSSSSLEKQSHEKKKKPNASTADAAYDSFMKEMQGLL